MVSATGALVLVLVDSLLRRVALPLVLTTGKSPWLPICMPPLPVSRVMHCTCLRSVLFWWYMYLHVQYSMYVPVFYSLPMNTTLFLGFLLFSYEYHFVDTCTRPLHTAYRDMTVDTVFRRAGADWCKGCFITWYIAYM